jgi:hypothetical protein
MKKSSTRSKRMKKQSRRSRKTRGGYTKVKTEVKTQSRISNLFGKKKHLYSVEFDDQEEEDIKDYKKNNPRAGGDDILNALFPRMEEKYKPDAVLEIQNITKMRGHDR